MQKSYAYSLQKVEPHNLISSHEWYMCNTDHKVKIAPLQGIENRTFSRSGMHSLWG